MQNNKFYYAGKHPAILKRLVYRIEGDKKYMSVGNVYAYTINFYLFYQDTIITWYFEDEDMRDMVYGSILDASMN